MAKKIGVLLSGCGVKDGSEIHEATLTLLALDRAGAEILCMAPNIDQTKVVNHLSGETANEKRNVLVEAARIARGAIKDIKNIKAKDIDGIILPGGFGAAINLSDFGIKGENCTPNPEVERLLKEMHQAGKPIGAICIAPATLSRVLGKEKITVTIGTDSATAKKIEAMGAKHTNCQVSDITCDPKNKIVTTPAYMLATRISQVADGIEKLVKKIMELAG